MRTEYGVAANVEPTPYSVVRWATPHGPSSPIWTPTSAGRGFISKNGNTNSASAVTFARLDTPLQPTRFGSGIYIDSTNPNRARSPDSRAE